MRFLLLKTHHPTNEKLFLDVYINPKKIIHFYPFKDNGVDVVNIMLDGVKGFLTIYMNINEFLSILDEYK